jgi:hypothetical protein
MEDLRLRVDENKVLRRILGPKREGGTESWRKEHNEDHHNLHSSPNITRMRWTGHVARMGRRGMHVGYWWEARRKMTIGRPRRKCEGNIKMGLREI